jgi:carbonic anhydrase/acetyltransferase-like protein (isoleucine patch superfamily)
VENACLIGMGAIILDGAVIGAESIVGAGALVTQGKVFAPRSLILGAPAKVVRTLADDEIARLYASADLYVALKNEYLRCK